MEQLRSHAAETETDTLAHIMVKPSTEIEREKQRLVAFRDVFQRFLQASEASVDTDEMFTEVSVAAGLARRAYALNDGKTFPVQDDRYIYQNADPMSHWQAVFSHDSDLSAGTVVSAVNLAIGRAEERLVVAREHERGFLGVISGILRWPRTLRDAVGGGRPQQRAAVAVGVVGQVLVGAATAWVVAAGTQLALWAWQAIAAAL